MIELAFAAAPAAFLLGLSFGSSACLMSCIPTLGVALLSQEGGTKSTVALTTRFNLGRMFGYTMLGVISGLLGASITFGLQETNTALLFGMLLIFSGLMLWQRGRAFTCSKQGKAKAKSDGLFKGSMFGMGLGMSLTPCAPLAGVCISAATTGSPWLGGMLGVSFALGAVIPAQLILGYGLGAAGPQLRSQLSLRAPQISKAGAALLVLVGAGVMGGVVHL